MSPQKMILGDKFINALTAAGLLPERTVSVVIRAAISEVVVMEYEVYGDDRLVGIAATAIEITEDESEAVAR
jgi:hypothetical protein